ncbi:hypothetical protein CEXT_594351 [Caerostris extrusa]|uniref:Uncharacterized protein n=1 Tax=Caerostris extrusa TaxID=172846 RepID=A0AAV4UXE2_CAEEX|nr:hypothetical protein CEXT_594351 [Caerostris extrusa]
MSFSYISSLAVSKKLKTCPVRFLDPLLFVCWRSLKIECVFTSVLSPPERKECRNSLDRFDSEQRTWGAVLGRAEFYRRPCL